MKNKQLVLNTKGEIQYIWQSKNGGEILGYWDVTPEEFDIKLKVNKFNL